MGGMASLLLLLWVGLTVGTVVDLQKRIYRGHNCKKKERLYHVKLIAKVDATHKSLCGGSLISDQWILTAAHCWKPGRTISAYLRTQPRIDLKENKILKDIFIFKDNTNKEHDIMLLKLPNKVQITPVKPPDCVNEYNDVKKTGATVQIAGHAATAPDSNNKKEKLQCANIKVVKCPPKIKVDKVDWSYQHWFCGQTTGKPLVDVCPGDSGGGVVYKKKIYGVISNSGKYTCTVEAAFLDVCEYIEWIKNVTGLN